MQIIAMMPVRNEAQLLPTSLGCLETFCDRVLILLDAQCTDNSLEVIKSFPKTQVIFNESASGKSVAAGALVIGRSLLFDAFRAFDGHNVGLCLDADEIAPPRIFASLRGAIAQIDRPGTVFSLWWVQLWKSFEFYRSDNSVWSNSWKPIAFHDDRRLSYPSDQPHFHESRTPVPAAPGCVQRLAGFPVLHMQWAAWERTQFKQASLRVFEYIHLGFRGAAEINAKYAVTLPERHEGVKPVEPDWLQDVRLPDDFLNPLPCWHRDRVLALCDQHGIERFEPLQIWHIPEFADRFLAVTGRAPKPKVYSRLGWTGRQAVAAMLPRSVRTLVKKTLYGRG
jgi:glycosyltransferase involved in cell wall biosynthesis